MIAIAAIPSARETCEWDGSSADDGEVMRDEPPLARFAAPKSTGLEGFSVVPRTGFEPVLPA
jgi:hypothetical protein